MKHKIGLFAVLITIQVLGFGQFTFSRYESLLELLSEDKYEVVTMYEYSKIDTSDKVLVTIRHDIDLSLPKAIQLAKLENKHGIRTTYFVLATASYYRTKPNPTFKQMQDLGHEIGVHNDLLSLFLNEGINPFEYNKQDLGYLHYLGLDIKGTASHGSSTMIHRKLINYYVFSEWNETDFDLPDKTLKEYGYEYEAYHLGQDHYLSDGSGRWIPSFDEILTILKEAKPGTRIQILSHPHLVK